MAGFRITKYENGKFVLHIDDEAGLTIHDTLEDAIQRVIDIYPEFVKEDKNGTEV